MGWGQVTGARHERVWSEGGVGNTGIGREDRRGERERWRVPNPKQRNRREAGEDESASMRQRTCQPKYPKGFGS